MSLLSLLHQSATSLSAHQAASSTASHNLSNASTPGFARQRAELATMLPADRLGAGYIGRGAVLQSVTQARDRFVEQQMPSALAAQTASRTEMETLQALTALDPDGGLSQALGDFYGQLRTLSQNAGSLHAREAAVAGARQLALGFNRVATSIEATRNGIDAKVAARLPEINEQAAQLARLNLQVRQAAASGAPPNDLLDARLRLADQLAESVGATPVPDGSGDLNLVLASGDALVIGGGSSSLSALPDPANRGHLSLRLTASDGSGPTTLSTRPGGELGGLLAARDGALQTAETSVDQFAFDLAAAVNAVATTGFALDGSTGRALFTGATAVTGAAKGLSLNTTIASNVRLLGAAGSATAGPGDAAALQRLIATETTLLTGGGDAASTLANITSAFGSSAERIAAIHAGDEAQLYQLNQLRDSVSGVSIDEELINMQKAQRAYEAVTKVIQTANEMLDSLMALR